MNISTAKEILEFKFIPTIQDEEILIKINATIEKFHKKQDGFIDAEVLKNTSEKLWYLILHYKSIANIKNSAENLKVSAEIDALKRIVVPDTIKISLTEMFHL